MNQAMFPASQSPRPLLQGVALRWLKLPDKVWQFKTVSKGTNAEGKPNWTCHHCGESWLYQSHCKAMCHLTTGGDIHKCTQNWMNSTRRSILPSVPSVKSTKVTVRRSNPRLDQKSMLVRYYWRRSLLRQTNQTNQATNQSTVPIAWEDSTNDPDLASSVASRSAIVDHFGVKKTFVQKSMHSEFDAPLDAAISDFVHALGKWRNCRLLQIY